MSLLFPSNSPSLTPAELESLASDRPLQTNESFKPNDFYGHAALLKRYAGLPDDFVIRAVMPHGPSFCSKLWHAEINDPCTTILAISEQQRALYNAQSPHKTVHVIGSPLLHAARLMADELAAIRAGARGTIVFPTHSTHHVTVEFDHAAFIRGLLALPPEFQPVRVCLYWRDIQLGRHRQYLEAGIGCTTAGHMFDPDFVPRVLRILSAHRHALANKLGSCVYYAAALGLPVDLRLQQATYTGPNPAQLAELSPSLDLPAAVRFAALAGGRPEAIAPVQSQLALAELGAEAVLSPAGLRALLESLPPLPKPAPARRAPARTAPLVETTLDSLVTTLRPLVAKHPRRVPGTIQLDGRPFAYADLHSVYHQSQQIFGHKLYDFRATSDQPVIIDGGAHVGLASLYFARRHPKAVIHAFEADPGIAAMLAANMKALDLSNVQVHASALWTTDDGVPFAATADDSGHVLPPAASKSPARVPSTRLRDFLAGQPVDLLKLDIEGAEFAVLQDCDGALGNVRNILIEVHRFRDGDGRLGELLSVLERNGFEYALGDLHAATWIDSAQRPPFTACASKHYIVTVFAWNPAATGSKPAPRPTAPEAAREAAKAGSFTAPIEGLPGLAPDRVVSEAIGHLNARREAEALRCLDRAAREGLIGPRLQYGRAVALARLGRFEESRRALALVRQADPAHGQAAALEAELEAASAPRLYIASYPRSGNTWLRLLLADVILQSHGYQTDTALPIHADFIIPDLHAGRVEDVDRRLTLPCRLLKSHDRFDKLAPGRAVCIFRQAADSLVSYYHFHRRYPNLAPKAADGVDAFCRAHVDHWREHLRSFLDARQAGAGILFLSYETLHTDSARALGEAARFIGLEAGDNACRRAVANQAFEKRQAAERQANGDKFAVPFFRKGKVNGADAELQPDTLAFVNAATGALYQEARAFELAWPARAGGIPTASSLIKP